MITQCATCRGYNHICGFCGMPWAPGAPVCIGCRRGHASRTPCDGRPEAELMCGVPPIPNGGLKKLPGAHAPTEVHCDCCGIATYLPGSFATPAGWQFVNIRVRAPTQLQHLCPDCNAQLAANYAVAWDTLLVRRGQSRLGATWSPPTPSDSGRDYCDQCGTPFSYGCIHTTTTTRPP